MTSLQQNLDKIILSPGQSYPDNSQCKTNTVTIENSSIFGFSFNKYGNTVLMKAMPSKLATAVVTVVNPYNYTAKTVV